MFDNPTQEAYRQTASKLALDVAAAKPLNLYKAFADSVREIRDEVLANKFMLCLLPPATYHVTVWNGVNEANVGRISQDCLQVLRSMLAGLPDSLAHSNPLLKTIQESSLVTQKAWSIDLCFDNLAAWHRRVLVARLKPANSRSRDSLHELSERAMALSDSVSRLLGMDMSQQVSPHVTIGYYANESRAESSFRELAGWNTIFSRNAGAATVTFKSIGLYAFTDMVSFIRMPDHASAWRPGAAKS